MDTKGIITSSVMNLMKKRNLSELTVQDILDEAQISRRTFYSHFTDKYDVINNYFSSQMRQEIKMDFTGSNWDEITLSLFCLLRDNARYFSQITADDAPNSFNNFLKNWFERKFTAFYLYNHQLDSLDSEEEYLRINFYAMGMLSYTSHIMKNPDKFKNNDTLKHYAAMVTSEIPEVYRKVLR